MHLHVAESIIAMKKVITGVIVSLAVILLGATIVTVIDILTGYETAEGVSAFARIAHNFSWIMFGGTIVHITTSRR